MKAKNQIYCLLSCLLLLFFSHASIEAETQDKQTIYYGSNEAHKTGVWLKDRDDPAEFLYQIKMLPVEMLVDKDIGERPKFLLASKILGSDRIALLINNRLHRDAHLVLVFLERGSDKNWKVIKEKVVLEKLEFESKVNPLRLEGVTMETTVDGNLRIKRPLPEYHRVLGPDGKKKFVKTEIKELVEDVDIAKLLDPSPKDNPKIK